MRISGKIARNCRKTGEGILPHPYTGNNDHEISGTIKNWKPVLLIIITLHVIIMLSGEIKIHVILADYEWRLYMKQKFDPRIPRYSALLTRSFGIRSADI